VSQFATVGSYTTSWGTPAIDVVCLFAGNYAADTVPYLRANNNNPPTQAPFNQNIQDALSSDVISRLQSLGITVMLSITNGWSAVGWSEFTSQVDAQRFVDYLKSEVVDRYKLDGIDIDDEYSTGTPQADSLAMVTTLMRKAMPNLLLSEALTDQGYLASSWNGTTLASNLAYAWNMNYGALARNALPELMGAGLNANQVSMGFWSAQMSRDPAGDVRWLKDNGYAGVMVFAFEDSSNVTLMGQLVNWLLGPGNWNQSF
jgi:hypothetical protein